MIFTAPALSFPARDGVPSSSHRSGPPTAASYRLPPAPQLPASAAGRPRRAWARFRGLVLVTAVAAALAACGGSAEERRLGHFQRAMALYEQGDPMKARLEFKNVLQIDPKHVESLYMLGRIAEEAQNFDVAYRQYSRAVHVGPEHVPARLALGGVYLLSGRVDNALEMAAKVLEQDPENVEALVLRGRCRARGGDFEGAMSDGQAALALDGSQAQAISLVSRLYIRQQRNEEALALLEEGIAANPRDVPLRLLLAQLEFVRGGTGRGAEVLEEILALEPDVLEHRVRLASLYVNLAAPERAEEVLRAGVDRDPGDVSAKLALVSLLKSQRGDEAAERELLELIEQNPSQHELRLALAGLYSAGQAHEKAEATYRRLIALAGDGVHGDQARIGLARGLAERGELEEARALVAKALERNPRNADALVLDGMIALERGDADGATASFRTVLRDAPRSADVLRLLARAYLANDRRALAVDALTQAVDAEPANMAARFEFARVLTDAGEQAEAAKQYRAILQIRPDHAGASEQLARIQIAELDWDAAEKTASDAKVAHSEAAWPYYYAGVTALSRGAYGAAAAELETALARAPEDERALLPLVKSYVGNGQEEKAVSMLDGRLGKNPDSLSARILLGELLLRQGKEREAVREFEKAINAHPRSELPYRLWARSRRARGDIGQTIELLERARSATDGSTGLLLELGVAHQLAGDPERAIGVFQQVLEKSPGSKAAANNLALLLATYRRDEASLDRARMLAEGLQDDGDPSYLDTLGWVYLRRGDVDAAIPLLERALASLPDSPEVHYHLGAAYQAKGEIETARSHLERALVQDAAFPGIEEARKRLSTLAGG